MSVTRFRMRHINNRLGHFNIRNTRIPFRIISPCRPTNSRPGTVRSLIRNIESKSHCRILLNIANSNGAFAVTGAVRTLKGPALIVTPGGALTTRLTDRLGRFFPGGTIICFISCCSCCRPRTCIPRDSACVRGSSSVGRRIRVLHRRTATSLLSQHSIVIITSISYVCNVNSPRSCTNLTPGISGGIPLRHSSFVRTLVSVRCSHGSCSLTHNAFHIHNSIISICPPCTRRPLQFRFFNSRIRLVTRVSRIAKRVLHRCRTVPM